MTTPLRAPSVRPAAPSNDYDVAPESGPMEAALSVDVQCDAAAVRVTLTDPRRGSLAAFAPLTAGQQTGLALDGWTIGLRAVLSAHRLAEESRLSNIGDTLVSEMERRLGAHLAQQQTSFGDALRRYFDPRDGQVTQRLDAFLRDDGDLGRTLATYFAPENGAVARTLAREIGEASPLLRKLSPTDAEGIVCLIQRGVESALQQNRTSVERALDPLAPDGAMARLLGELRREVSEADKDQADKLARITKALDANDESSLLSRLFAETQGASQKLLASMNPELPGSALATLKASLTTALDGHRKHQAEILEAFSERQRKHEQAIHEAVTRLETQRAADAKSPRGGDQFEDAVAVFVGGALHGASYIVDRVGARVGAVPNSKKGDMVVSFPPDSPFAGSKVVVEAKHDKKYGVSDALAELEEARRNRGASVGVFVFATSHAPPGFCGVRRYGEDILVVWDPEDSATDPYLEVALTLGLALAARGQRVGDEGDLQALASIEAKVLAEIRRHEEIRGFAENISRDAEKIARALDVSDKKLGVMLRDAKKTLRALNVELEDADAARKAPVAMPNGALARGRSSLARGEK